MGEEEEKGGGKKETGGWGLERTEIQCLPGRNPVVPVSCTSSIDKI